MQVKSSYKIRDKWVHRTTSVPVPSVKNLTDVLKHVAWVASQPDSRVEVIEG